MPGTMVHLARQPRRACLLEHFGLSLCLFWILLQKGTNCAAASGCCGQSDLHAGPGGWPSLPDRPPFPLPRVWVGCGPGYRPAWVRAGTVLPRVGAWNLRFVPFCFNLEHFNKTADQKVVPESWPFAGPDEITVFLSPNHHSGPSPQSPSGAPPLACRNEIAKS